MSTASGNTATAPRDAERPASLHVAGRWFAGGATLLLLLGGLIFLVPTLSVPGPDTWAFPGFGILISLALLVLGIALTTRQPENRIGWLFLVATTLGAVQVLASSYARYSLLVGGGPDDLANLGNWIDAWVWFAPVAIMSVGLFVLFPDGLVASPTWRGVLWAGAVSAGVGMIASALDPGFGDAAAMSAAFDNPFGLSGTGDLLSTLSVVGVIGMTVAMGGGVLALVSRLRDASGVERRQITWLLASSVLTTAAFVVYAVSQSKLGEVLIVLGLLAIPAGATVAILRYRLWDIDLIVNRTLVYVPLTGLLAGLYAVGVAGFQRAFVAVTGEESDAPIILIVLVLAALFTPVRNRLQGIVDARFKGDVDPIVRLRSFAREIDADYRLADPQRLAGRVAQLVKSSTGATEVGLEVVREGHAERLESGAPPTEPAFTVAVDGDLGLRLRLSVGPRPSGRPFAPADEAAVGEVGRATLRAMADATRANATAWT